MKALLYKDLVTLKKIGLLLLLVLAVVCFIGIRQGAIVMLPFLFVLVPVLLLGILFGADTQSKVDSYIIPGPVTRSTIVLSRYTFIWLLTVSGIIFTLLLQHFTQDTILEKVPWHLIIAIMSLMTTFLAAIQIPLMYKFGAEQGRLIFVVLYFLIFALFSYLGGQKEFILELINKASGVNTYVISIAVFAFALLINILCFTISVKIYAKKKF